MSQEASLAQRKRQLVRDELSGAAMKLLDDRRYDAITVEDIAEAAGVSRRTFFRYFPTKEDAFVVHFLRYFAEEIPAALAARPAEERPSDALRRSLPAAPSPEDADRAFDLAVVTLTVPALRTCYLDHQAQWRASLAAQLARRTAVDAEIDMRPTLAAGMALLAFDTALQWWTTSDHRGVLAEVVDEAFDLVAPAIDRLFG